MTLHLSAFALILYHIRSVCRRAECGCPRWLCRPEVAMAEQLRDLRCREGMNNRCLATVNEVSSNDLVCQEELRLDTITVSVRDSHRCLGISCLNKTLLCGWRHLSAYRSGLKSVVSLRKG